MTDKVQKLLSYNDRLYSFRSKLLVYSGEIIDKILLITSDDLILYTSNFELITVLPENN